MTILVAGGASTSGASFVLSWIGEVGEPVINVDNVTHGGSLHVFSPLAGDSRHRLILGDLSERRLIDSLLVERKPRAVVHFASEPGFKYPIEKPDGAGSASHQPEPAIFEAARSYWETLPGPQRAAFRFVRVAEAFANCECPNTRLEDDFTCTHPRAHTVELKIALLPMTAVRTLRVALDRATCTLMALLCDPFMPQGERRTR